MPGVDITWFDETQKAICLATYTYIFPRGIDTVVEDGLIEASRMGVSFDRGTENGSVNNVTFRNYSFSAIMFLDNVSSGNWPWYDDGGTQTNNTFEQCDVCGLTFDHPNNGAPTCEDSPPACP